MRKLALATAVAFALATPAAASADTEITLTDQTWTCNQPLSNYGTLPIRVVINYTTTDTVEFGVRLGTGCTGDGNSATVDLELDINGDGINGPYIDAVRILNASPGASDIVITGEADCGRARPESHQDGVQALGGTNITFRDFEVGFNGPGGNPSCQGAGGAMFYSAGSATTAPDNMRVEGGEYRACNRSLLDGVSPGSGHIENAIFRSGYDTNHPDACEDSTGDKFNIANPCVTSYADVTESNIVCDQYPFVSASPLVSNVSLGAGATLTLTVPSGGVPAGETLVIATAYNGGQAGITVADSDGNTYVSDRQQAHGTNLVGAVLSARITDALEAGDTISITYPEVATRRLGQAITLAGLLETSFRGSATSQGQTAVTALSSGSATTTTAHAIVIGVFGWNNGPDGADTFAPGSGFTALSTLTADNRQLFTSYDEVTATGSYAATATASASGNAASLVATYYAP
jgi:hypothetical protein